MSPDVTNNQPCAFILKMRRVFSELYSKIHCVPKKKDEPNA
jgi:hypothetical protein